MKAEQRQQTKDRAPQFHPDGRERMEMVVTLRTFRSNMVAGAKRVYTPVEPGDLVRLILKGGGFGQWIEAGDGMEAKHRRGIEVGDMLRLTTDYAIRYTGDSSGTELGRVDTADALKEYMGNPQNLRSETLGFRGQLAVRPPKPDEESFAAQCVDDYHRLTREHVPAAAAPAPAYQAGPGAADDDEDF